jgi:hypothetical protein
VITPVNTQAISSHIGDPTLRAMAADVMKMPEPIIEPATSIVASVSVMAWTNSVFGRVAASVSGSGGAAWVIAFISRWIFHH